MMKDQFAAMPACQSGKNARQDRKYQSVRQDLVGEIEPNAPIGADNGEQRHGGDCMCPACHAHANTRNEQQFERTYDAGGYPGEKGKARRPKPRAQPEFICAPPVEHVGPERCDRERDRKMNAHGMDGMTGNGDSRADLFVRNLLHSRIVVAAGFAHSLSPVILDAHREHAHRAERNLEQRGSQVQRRGPGALFLAASVLALAGCSGPLSALDPVGPSASAIAALWWAMFWGSAIIVAAMIFIGGWAFLRPSSASRISTSHWIIYGGLVVPSTVIFALLVYALFLGERLLPHPGAEPAVTVEAHGVQWQWQFRYRGLDIELETIDRLHIPADSPIDVIVTSGDIIHSFWVPRLAGKMDAIPGHENVLRLVADEPGIYRGVCAEFCGDGHAGMDFAIEVHDRDDYDNVLRNLNGTGDD